MAGGGSQDIARDQASPRQLHIWRNWCKCRAPSKEKRKGKRNRHEVWSVSRTFNFLVMLPWKHCTLSLILLSKVTNFIHLLYFLLLCLCFVSKCVAVATARGQKHVSKMRSDVRAADKAMLPKSLSEETMTMLWLLSKHNNQNPFL